MIRTLLLTTSLLVASAGFATAQGLAVGLSGPKEIKTLSSGDELSKGEQRYLDELAKRLGEASKSGAIQVPYGPSDLSPGSASEQPQRTQVAVGVAARVGGLEVKRLRFRSREDAQKFAIYAVNVTGKPTLVEVRGRQLVIVRGERVSKPDELAAIREAAWSTLPKAPGAPSVAGLVLSGGTHSYSTRVPNEHLDDFVKGALEEARREGKPGVVDGERATESWPGHSHSVEARERGSELWVHSSFDREVDPSPAIRALHETLERGSEKLEAAKAKLETIQHRPQRQGINSALSGPR